ncbi:hypothetical protein J6590_022623 [Homalodisca vitripennis]|nr:hypothetical protein J6590_022623 [Homalodisca vitripennis]
MGKESSDLVVLLKRFGFIPHVISFEGAPAKIQVYPPRGPKLILSFGSVMDQGGKTFDMQLQGFKSTSHDNVMYGARVGPHPVSIAPSPHLPLLVLPFPCLMSQEGHLTVSPSSIHEGAAPIPALHPHHPTSPETLSP